MDAKTMKAVWIATRCGIPMAIALASSLAFPSVSAYPIDPPASSTPGRQVSGTLGAPDATVTIRGNQLPAPDQPFCGKIEQNAAQSRPCWPARIAPPKGAPNVLLIMTDDVGFGAPSTFGGVIPTPALDRIARMGLRYNNFHTTSLCSPTRAALITGRNHHAVGFGMISEGATGYPGYDSLIPENAATIGRILQDNGYATSWFGKDHNTPSWDASQLGPFKQWPTGMGFQYFYGFIGGDTSQWEPGNLFRNTTPIHPYVGHPGWNLGTAEADDAIHWLTQLNDIDPSRPFLLYFAPGGTHAPYQPTPYWEQKISAMHLFDKGWNDLRRTIFANQKRLGVIPQSARLTPWPDKLLKRWDTLTPLEKKLFIKQADTYAAYLAYTDHEIGRVVDEVAREGKLDNTLIIYISGDNGASAEGSPNGTPSEVLQFNGIQLPVAQQMKFYDAWGSDRAYSHMAVGWAWAFDTPFKWVKQIPSFFGGTANGMAIAWPGHIKDAGGMRHQFAYVTDIVPTILQSAHIPAPSIVNGIRQKPMDGASLAYTFSRTGADAPSRHETQYFEMFGLQGLYHDGWMLSAVPKRPPWQLLSNADMDPAHSYTFELFDIKHDWTQDTDLAARYPDKVRQMHALMFQQFKKYQVFPLDASVAPRLVTPRPNLTTGRHLFTYSGTPVTGLPRGTGPNLLNTSYTIIAQITVPEGGASGMIVTDGGRMGGYGMYLLDSKPVFTWNLLDLQRLRWEDKTPLAPGKHTIVYDFKYDGLGFATLAFNQISGLGRGGVGTFSVDGNVVSTQTLKRTVPLTLPWDESFDIGSDTGTPVDDKDYQVPFAFTGTIDNLTFAVAPPKLTPQDVQKLRQAEAAANDAR